MRPAGATGAGHPLAHPSVRLQLTAKDKDGEALAQNFRLSTSTLLVSSLLAKMRLLSRLPQELAAHPLSKWGCQDRKKFSSLPSQERL